MSSLQFDQDFYSQALQEWTDLFRRYLNELDSHPRGLKVSTGPELLKMTRQLQEEVLASQENTLEKWKRILGFFLEYSQPLHSPHSIGHQVAPPTAIAALAETVGSTLNQAGAVFEMGPVSTMVERLTIEMLCEQVGWSTKADGIVTHGGSLGNLTALLAARAKALPSAWSQSLNTRAALLVSRDAHYSMARAAGIMGIGTENVITVDVDQQRRMRPEDLEAKIENLQNQGTTVLAVIGSACTTPTGAFDPLEQIGAIAAKHNIWFHVDAAHGGGMMFSSRLRERLKGIEKADSIVWDSHKMMHTPALATFVLFQRGEDSFRSFHQNATYLFDERAREDLVFDSGLRTVECTKHALAFPAWCFSLLAGTKAWAELTERLCDQTQVFADLLLSSGQFEVPWKAQSNILCFRYKTDRNADELQLKIRERLIQSGHFYITGTQLDGRRYLRVTIMNPATELTHLRALVAEIGRLAKSLSA